MEPISKIDDSINQLFFRGFDVTELSMKNSFETVLYLLINGKLPCNNELREISQRLVDLRGYYNEDVSSLVDLVRNLKQIREENQLGLLDILLTFVSLAPLVVANKFGEYNNRKIEKPNSNLGHATNFLWMTQCVNPNDIDVRDIETSLILHMDDPSNPSLSALRACIEDGKSVSDALLAALAVHAGPLHHGAGTEAMVMFEEIRHIINVEDYLNKRLESGEKIFGIGHRIYRGTDPRAIVLRKILERRTKNTSNVWLFEVIDRIEKAGYSVLKKRKNIEAYPNVDLYNAAVYYSLGFPPTFNTELFAISRAVGWISHILEWLSE